MRRGEAMSEGRARVASRVALGGRGRVESSLALGHKKGGPPLIDSRVFLREEKEGPEMTVITLNLFILLGTKRVGGTRTASRNWCKRRLPWRNRTLRQ